MNDKDKEAFEKWWHDRHDKYVQFRDWQGCDLLHEGKDDNRDGWQAACEYKQKEIDELKKQIYVKGSIHKEGNQKREMTWQESSDMMERIVQSRTKRLEQLQAENAKLNKQINELEKEKDYLCQKMEKMRTIYKDSEKLQAENAKLRECVEFYADEANQIAPIYKHDGRNRPGADFTAPYRMDEGKRARQVLKELEDK